jgi:hypothetical protein
MAMMSVACQTIFLYRAVDLELIRKCGHIAAGTVIGVSALILSRQTMLALACVYAGATVLAHFSQASLFSSSGGA